MPDLDANKRLLEQIAKGGPVEKPGLAISSRSFSAGDPKFRESTIRVNPNSFSQQGSVRDRWSPTAPAAGGILAGSQVTALAKNSLTNAWDAKGRLLDPSKRAEPAGGVGGVVPASQNAPVDGRLAVQPLLTEQDRDYGPGFGAAFGRLQAFGAGDPLLMKAGAASAGALTATMSEPPQVPESWRDAFSGSRRTDIFGFPPGGFDNAL